MVCRVGWFLAISLVLLVLGCEPAKEPAPPPPAAPAAPAAPSVPVGAAAADSPALNALVRHFGGAQPGEATCVIVAVHGLGDRPESFASLFSGFDVRSRVVLPRAPDPWGPGYSWFPFRPNAKDSERATALAGAARRLATFIGGLPARERRGKVVLTGFSQGGMLSFAVAAMRPELIAAAVPVSGALPEAMWPTPRGGEALPTIVALHGDADDRVPIKPARRAVAAFVDAGYTATLSEHSGVNHTISPRMKQELFSALAAACR